ncbi:MAG: ATP-binding protein [Candidatus Zixiibacteriota bacterium]|nr:MAG: ATP-binding protein [candidate division Zixibacteria bacterium]
MSVPGELADTTIRLSESVTRDSQKQLADLVSDLTDRGGKRLHIDCSDLSLLTREHIWLLLQVQTQCQMQGITVILSAPTLTLFNIETLGSLIEASSSLTKRPTPQEEPKPGIPPAKAPLRLEQRFRARASELGNSTREFESFMTRLKIAKVDRYVLRTLYTEAVQNIYRHAGLKDNQEIQVQVERTGKCLSLTFVDEGQEFDPTAESVLQEHISDPSAVEFPHFGIKMLKRLADDITYQRSQSGKNVLRIIKELQI